VLPQYQPRDRGISEMINFVSSWTYNLNAIDNRPGGGGGPICGGGGCRVPGGGGNKPGGGSAKSGGGTFIIGR